MSDPARRGRVRLYHEDCIAGMSRYLAAGAVDVVVTSPPYNLGTVYSQYDDSRARGDYLAWLDRWAAETRRVLSPAGSLFLNLGSKPTDPWVSYDVLMVMRKHFHLQNQIHWIKSISLHDGPVTGHVKPLNSARFLNDAHEFLFHLTPEGTTPLDKLAVGVPFADKSNLTRGQRGRNGDRRDRGNVWFIPYQTIQNRDRDRPHPATFPQLLPERCIRLHGLERTRLVCDPFMGLGSTGVAAVRLGVDFIGFETDAVYSAAAIRAIEGTVRQEP